MRLSFQEVRRPGIPRARLCNNVDADGVSKTRAGALGTPLTRFLVDPAPGPTVQAEGVSSSPESQSQLLGPVQTRTFVSADTYISLTHGGLSALSPRPGPELAYKRASPGVGGPIEPVRNLYPAVDSVPWRRRAIELDCAGSGADQSTLKGN